MRTKLGERNHGDSSGRFRIFPKFAFVGFDFNSVDGSGGGLRRRAAIFGGRESLDGAAAGGRFAPGVAISVSSLSGLSGFWPGMCHLARFSSQAR